MKQTKTILSMLCAAALFAACSSTDELEPVVQTGQQTESEAVGFDVYTRGTTRAGYVGDIDATTFQATGFGVYAYVSRGGKTWNEVKTEDHPYSEEWTPDFMANQYVSYNSSAWTYSPVKYWPNQANTGTEESNRVDGLGSGTATTTDGIDYVSFFAYAPYVESTNVPFYGKDETNSSVQRAAAAALKNTGTEESPVITINSSFGYDGIISLPGADEAGNPKITYVVPANPAYGVDLMYGVAARNYILGETTGNKGATVTAGMPFLDMTKEVVDDKISYRFQHALTKLGINVDAYFDEVSGSHTNDVDANTRIVIESISIQGTAVSNPQKLYSYGVLNLNNTPANTPRWEDQNAEVTNLTSRIANGLKLVEITTTGAASLETATKEEGAKYFALQPLGVTKTKKSLFGNDISGNGNATLMLIPGANNATASAVSVTIKYHVITRDANLANGVSDITNEITNSLGDVALKAGSQTIINMHLGMTTVKIDAQVADWDGANTQEVDLPANVAVESLTATSFSVTNVGKITAEGIKATLSGVTDQKDLSLADVYFTTDDPSEVLPVKSYGETPEYYIPGNYTNDNRDIYMWYGGKKYETKAEQPKLTTTELAISVDPATLSTNGGNVALKVTPAASVKEPFNCGDWTVSAGDVAITLLSTDSATGTFNIKVPASAAGTITFKLKHKDGLELTQTLTISGS